MSRISIRKVTVTLAAIAAGLTVAGLVTQWLAPGEAEFGTWTHVFDLADEATLPAWFQTAMLLASGALLWKIGSSCAPDDRFARHWKFLAGVFVYISADENGGLHETGGFWISEHVHWANQFGVYIWLLPAFALIAGLGVSFWKFFRHLSPRVRTTMIISAVVYVGGAAGMEIVEAYLDDLSGTFTFSVLAIVEESLEMAGLVIFIYALLSHLKTVSNGGTLTIDP